MITPTNIARSLLAIAILSCAIAGPAPAAPHNAPARHAPTHVRTRINLKDGAEMVYVPAGEFTMGDNDLNKEAYHCPEHRIYLDAYWTYKSDVTVAQYRKFCKATGRKMPPAPRWGWKADHPVVNVTWYEAKAYCAWAGAALPTEAQWEKAARGTDGRRYPWGNDWDPGRLRWGPGGTAPVGSDPGGASPYGCLDMAGNVWQWCADWYDDNYYAHSPVRNPAGPATGTDRVVRGGSWSGSDEYVFRSAARDYWEPVDRDGYGGFRCVVRAGG